MALREGSPNVAKAELYLTATDISDRVLAKAVSGQYLAMDVERGLSADRLQRYFVQEGETWKVKPELKKCVTFRRLNLLEPFVFNPPFDIILCRNVAIYFTEADKMRLFKNMSKCLATDGALLIGSTESITGLCPEFEPARHGRSVFYRLSVGKN